MARGHAAWCLTRLRSTMKCDCGFGAAGADKPLPKPGRTVAAAREDAIKAAVRRVPRNLPPKERVARVKALVEAAGHVATPKPLAAPAPFVPTATPPTRQPAPKPAAPFQPPKMLPGCRCGPGGCAIHAVQQTGSCPTGGTAAPRATVGHAGVYRCKCQKYVLSARDPSYHGHTKESCP